MRAAIVIFGIFAFIWAAPYMFAPEKHSDPLGKVIKKAVGKRAGL